MKKLENLFRRALSMVLCLSMLMGNMGGAFADVNTNNSTDIEVVALNMSAVALEMDYKGIRKAGYNDALAQYEWLDHYQAYYEITATVSGVVEEAKIKFDHGFAAAADPKFYNENENVNAVWSAGDNSIVLTAKDGTNVPEGAITFVVGVPLQDSAVAGLLNGHVVTSKVSHSSGSSASHQVALNPQVSFTREDATNNGQNFNKWILTYQCEGIQLTNTYLTATVNAGNILDWNSNPQLSVTSHGVGINGHEGKGLTDTISFGPLTGYYDHSEHSYDTDLQVIFYSEAVDTPDPVICNLTINPESVGAVRNLSATTASPVAISKVGKAVVINGEKYVQWTVKLNYALAIQNVTVKDTFANTVLSVDGNRPFTIAGVTADGSTLTAKNTDELNNMGVQTISGETENGFSLTINQHDSKAKTPVVITYYTAVEKLVQEPSYNNTYFLQDTANIRNTAELYVNDNGTEKLASTVTANVSDTVRTLKVSVITQDATTGQRIEIGGGNLKLLVSAVDPAGNPVTNAVQLEKTEGSVFHSGLMYDAQNGAKPCLLVPADGNTDTDEERANYVRIGDQNYKYYQLNDILHLDRDGQNGDVTTSDFFEVVQISENGNELIITLTNDKMVGLEGLSEAYRGQGDFLINTNTNEFTKSSGEIFDNTAYNGSLNEYKYDPRNYLGIAGNFHIVAFEKVWNGGDGCNGSHVNGNMLAKELYSGNNFGTNGLDFEVTYIQKYCGSTPTMASSDNHLLVLGSYNEFALTENNMRIKTADGTGSVTLNQPKNIMVDLDTAANPFIDLGMVESQIKGVSSSLNAESDNGISVDFTDQNNRTLTLNSADSAGYLTLTSSQLNEIKNNPLYLKGFKAGHQGSMVINVICDTNTVYMPQKAQIFMDGSSSPEGTGEVTDFTNGRVIWNFVNAAGKKIYTPYSMTGMIIAPDADVWVRGNVNGTIVADYVHIEGESHRTDFKGTITPAQGNLSAKKYVDGNSPNTQFTFYLQEGTYDQNNRKASFPDQTPKQKPDGQLEHDGGVIATVTNSGTSITFPNMTFNQTGTRVFRIGELETEETKKAYTLDKRCYYVKVVVSSLNAGGDTKYFASFEYYNDAALTEKLKGPEQFVFNNTTKSDQPGTTNISGSKSWNDNDNQDGKRPDNVTLQLYKSTDGGNTFAKVEGQTVTTDQSKNWMWTFSGLEEIKPNSQIRYKVVEEPVPEGYTASYNYEVIGHDNVKNSIVVTNTHNTENAVVKVYKNWMPQDGTSHPESINVYLEYYNPADGNWHKVEGSDYELKASDGWTHIWNNIPKYQRGETVRYRVVETPITGYTASYESPLSLADGVDFETQILNTWIEQKEETTEVTLTKTWNDNGNEDERPGAIVVVLRRWTVGNDGKVNLWGAVDTTFNQIVTIQPVDGQWSYTWTGLPKYVPGTTERYLYYVDEIPFGDNYAVYNRYDGDWSNTFPVKMTNTYVAPTTQKLEATKNLQGGALSENQFTFELTGDNGAPMPVGTENGVYTVKNGNNGNVSSIQFGDISFVLSDLKNVADTNESVDIVEKTKTFTYTIREKNEGEEGVVYDDTVYKAQIVLSYRSNGTQTECFTASAPKYYKVKEDGSWEEISSAPTFVNTTGAEMVEVTVNKGWKTTAANEAVIELWSKDSNNNRKQVGTITLPQNGQWTYTWKNLPQKDSNNQLFTYYVKEQPVNGYITSYTGNGNNDADMGMFAVNFNGQKNATVNVVNTETVQLTVSKQWEGTTGNSAKVELWRKIGNGAGERIGNVIDLPINGYQWNYTWNNLPKYDENTTEYTYYVVEQPISGYTTTYTGNCDSDGNVRFNNNTAAVTVCNRQQETVRIVVRKQWQGDNESDRPASVTVTLKRGLMDGTKDNGFIETLVLQPNNWSGYFDNLLKYNDQNQQYLYYIEETAVDGYIVTYTNRDSDGKVNFNGQNQTEVNIINRKQEFVEITIEKRWEGVDETQTQLPEVTVVLQRFRNWNPSFVDDYRREIKLNSSNHWTVTVEDLEKSDSNNSEYTYFITEVPVDGYETNFTQGINTGWNNAVQFAEGSNSAYVVITNRSTGNTPSPTPAETPTPTPTVTTTVTPTTTPDVTPAPEFVTLTLTKIWDDGEYANSRPNALLFSLSRVTDDNGNKETSWLNDPYIQVTINGNTVTANRAVNATTTVAEDGSWTLTFDKYMFNGQWHQFPRYDESGKEYQYFIEEQTDNLGIWVDGQLQKYDVSHERTNTETIVTNSYGDGKTSVTVNKQWVGGDANTRPNITVQLLANGDAVDGKSITLPQDGNWTYTFDNLAKKQDGQEISYTVVETNVPADYVSSTEATGNNTFTITNTYIAPVEVELAATKTLNGADLAADQFTFELYSSDGQKLATAKNDADGNVTFPFITYKLSDVAGEVDNSKTFTYSIKEIAGSANGYTYDKSEYTAAVTVTYDAAAKQLTASTVYTNAANVQLNTAPEFINTYVPAPTTIQIPVVKELEVGDGLVAPEIEGKFTFTMTGAVQGDESKTAPLPAPASITNGKAGEEVKFNAITFTEVGTYVYTITESNSVPGVTNDSAATTGKTVTVVVTDQGNGTLRATADYGEDAECVTFTNTYEAAPASVIIPVQKNYTVPDGATATNIAGKFTFTLAAADNCPAGYEFIGDTSVTNPAEGTVNFGAIKFTKPDTYSFTVTESGSAEGVVNDPTISKTVTVTVTDNGCGQLVVADQAVKTIDAVEFTNTYVAPISVELKAKKTVTGKDLAAEQFTFELYNSENELISTAKNDANGNVTFQLEQQFDLNDAGETFTYTIKESKTNPAVGYLYTNKVWTATVAISLDAQNVLNRSVTYADGTNTSATVAEFVNEYAEVKLTGTKTWVDNRDQYENRPENIQLDLYRDGEKINTVTPVIDKSANADVWTWTISGLPKYVGNKEVTYTVKEVPVTGYTSQQADNGIDFTNTLEKINVPVEKVWNDNNDAEGFRPGSIQLQLVKVTDNSESNVGGSVTVNTNNTNKWSYTFTDLPKYENKQLVNYSVKELEVPNYTSVVVKNADGSVTVTNSRDQEFVKMGIQKVWEDNDDQDNIRPESLTVTLSNGATVTLNQANNWTATVDNLPKYADGEEIEYTWTESLPTGYTLTKTETSDMKAEGEDTVIGTLTTLTNSHTPAITEASVRKVWEDDNNRDRKRPESLTVTLSNGDTVTLNQGNNWTAKVEDLPKYANGTEIEYTWTEEQLPADYTLTGTVKDGTLTTLTNSYTIETVNVSVEKVWDDNNNQDGIRPDSITVNLLADGGVVSENGEVELNGTNYWKYTWENLPKYDNGVAITYTVVEKVIPTGYNHNPDPNTEDCDVERTVDGTTGAVSIKLTNHHAPETTSVAVTKQWNDADNQDGNRPTSITFILWSALAPEETTAEPENTEVVEGTEAEQEPQWTQVTSITTTKDNWNYTFSNLPVYQVGAVGQKLMYKVTEADLGVDGYSSEVSGDAENGFTVTNSYTPELTEATVKKVWDDAENQDGKRPDELKVTLSNGTEVTLNEVNDWTATITGLPKNANGTEIEYTWTEDEAGLPEGYELTDTSVDGTITTLTNSYTTEQVDVYVEKVWDDANNQDGKRPANLTINLMKQVGANGEKKLAGTITLPVEGQWSYTWSDLDKFEAGTVITYTVEEVTANNGEELSWVTDYKTRTNECIEVNRYKLTNTHTPELTEATVKKVWDDDNNRDQKRPESLTVTLSNGTEVTLNEDNGWTAKVENLPKYANGTEIEYTWTEEQLPTGYTLTGTSVNGTITTLTNRYAPEETAATVKKVWDDADDQDGIRPESLTVTLSNGDTVTLNQDNKWTATVANLPKFENGVEIEYTWTEGALPEGYTLTSTKTEGTITTLTNSHTPEETEATVTKVWDDKDDQDGKRPESLTVTLSNGDTVTLNEKNDWTATVKDLPKYDKGAEIKYTWTEGELPKGYELTDTSVNGTITTLTNSHAPEKVSITVEKVWNDAQNQDGIRPESIYVQLYADNALKGAAVELNDDNLSYTWIDLDKYVNGNQVEYTVLEGILKDGKFEAVEKFEGYTADIGNAVETETANTYKITITNSHTPATTEATVKKVWVDGENQDNIRPQMLVVTLSNGKEVPLSQANDWTATVKDLPKYANGEEIEYAWTEGELPEGYKLTDTSVNGTITTLTNSHTPELTEAKVIKVWDDANDQDGKRPTSLTVTLSNGTKVTLNKNNNWTATVENLPKYKNGEEIAYTWTEETLPEGYSLTGNSKSGTVTTLTNSYSTEVTQATIVKVWDDADDQDDIRPESLTVTLSNGTTTVGTVTLNEDNGWTDTIANLPKYANGTEIEYTWTEDEESLPDGYELTGTSVNGTITTLTNTHKPATTEATVKKVWADAENQDGIRPESLTVTLSNGTVVTLNEKNDWTATVKDLPKYDKGAEIKYTWTEGALPKGYELTDTSVNGTITTLTNSHAPEKVSITVEKVWNDAQNQDGIRPESIYVQLYADNALKGAAVELNDDNLSYTWIDLDKYANGNEVKYTVLEGILKDGEFEAVEKFEGYTADIGNAVETETANTYKITITNSHTPATTEATVKKVWVDGENQDNIRPQMLVVTLSNGKEVTLSQANDWTATVKDLPKCANGTEIEYTWTEDEESLPEGYELTGTTKEGTITTLTNSHTPELTEAKVIKVWDDANDQDGKRPTSLTVTLSNGDTVTLNEENGWTATIANLPKYANGTEIEYTWTEDEAGLPEGYKLISNETEGKITTITNKHTPELIEATVKKVWDDNENQDGKRPESLTVTLSNGTTTVGTVTLTKDKNWTDKIGNLPKYANGVEIEYTWTEDETGLPAGYTLTNTVTEGNLTTLTNSYTPEKTSASVKKVWDDAGDQDGKRPESLTVTLKNGNVTVGTVTLSAAKNWTDKIENLPKYANGVEIEYTWTEGSMPAGYRLTDTKKEGTITTLTNSYDTAVTSATVRKVWNDANNQDGIRPESLTVTLSNGTEVVLSEANGWTATIDHLPVFANGEVIEYTWTEGALPEGYKLTDTSVEGTITTLTNTHVPETVSVNGKKTWVDGNNQDNSRPVSITINLLANGETAKDADGNAITATASAGDWAWTFDGLPKNKRVLGEDGKYTTEPIVYTVAEEPVNGYTTDYDGMNVTNTNQPDVVSVRVEKVWKDNNNQDGKRPESITVQLVESYKQGDATVTNNYGNPVTLDAAHGWSYTWTDLPKYQVGGVGNRVTYTIAEVDVPADYSVSYGSAVPTDENGSVSYTITNTDTPDVISISGSKEWDDANNQDGIRPSSITINLLADGTKVDSKTVTADANGNWSWTFTGMPKYKAGEVGVEIQYTITEDAIAFENTKTSTGYTPEPNGFNMKNTHVPETVEVKVIKDWKDMDDQDGKRPDDITVVLLADGNEKDRKTIGEDEGWTWTFTNLPKYAAGMEIEYTIEELEVDEYDATISEPVVDGKVTTYTITNTYDTETTEVEVTKVWEDDNDRDGERPGTITVVLLADGKEVKTKTISGTDDWKHTFTDLPKFRDGGVKIDYTIEELEVTGYDVVITGTADEGFTITNTNEPEKMTISGTKTWDDADDQDGIRPESITINLLADGEEIQSATVTPDENGDWSWTFSNLNKYRDHGDEIEYTITEDEITYTKTSTGYEAVIDGYDVKNTHKPDETQITVTKAWDDAGNQDKKRPTSITINLLANGTKVNSVTFSVDEDGKWSNLTHTFTGLPKFADGEEIAYTVSEDHVANYTTTITGTAAAGFLVTNKHEPEKITISGTKTWDDANDQDGIRPTSIIINLLADGTKLDSKTVTANDGWEWSWTGLDKYKAGEVGVEIQYTITEDTITYDTEQHKTGYDATITGYDVKNTHAPETVKVEGKKIWNDADNQDNKRPESITINLLADGEKISSQTITPDADGNWPGWKFEDLPKFKAGEEINYTITENAVAGYTTSVTGYNVENSYKPGVTSVTVSKTWDDDNNRDGIRPTSITFNLLADGEKIGSKTITPDADGNWPTYTFDNLPINKVGKVGQKVNYTVTEEAVDGYTATFEGDAATGYVFTNTHKITTTNISGTKTWDDANDQDGIRPESITIRLLANGTAVRSAEVKADENGEWKYTFTDLPVNENGKAITYTISEDPITLSSEKTKTGYTTKIDGFNVKNTHVPETTEVTVTKEWDDADNQDGKRPASITIRLYANGNEVDSETISADADGKWSFTFTDLPKFAAGMEITYTISEDAVDKYTTEIDGFSVTNTHVPETTEVTVTKDWDDADNQDGKRPASITINLLANGEKVKSETISVDTEGNWSHTFTELPKYAAGKEITYTITEEAVAEYTTVIDGFNVENTHKPEVVEVSGTKTWTDADDQDGYRPTSITINLLADSKVIKTITVTEAEGWSWKFTELPKYAAGKEITYTITEEAVAEYTTSINGYDVTNTHKPELIEIAGTKTWNDADNQDGIRPTSITINLLADGKIVKTATVTEADGWSWKFTELPKYAAGKEIAYTINEDALQGYTTSINGYDVTNTHEPELIEVAGTKTWNDADNQDGKRPASIVIKLMDGATVVESVTVTEAEGWSWKFTDLPKYRPGAVGVLIEYKVIEELDKTAAAEYSVTVDGYNITNTHTPETVQITGSKTWNDLNNKYLKRPDSVTIRLLANGTEVAHQVVTEADNWSWTFTDLPKYEAGKVIKYSIKEDVVTGYISTVEDFNVTNAMNMVEFIKTDEQTGKRLAGAKFALYEGALGTFDASKPVETWVSDLNTKVLTGLKVGQTYTIVETEAPSGYAMMTPFQFTVQLTDIPGTYRAFSVSNCHVYRFRKLDSSNNGLVSGAKLAVLDSTNAVIDSWVTSDANGGWHEIADYRLVAGKEYKLVELDAPWGYELADPITFSVDEDKGMLVVNDSYTGKAEVVMYDAPWPEVTPTPEPTTTSYTVTKRWEDKENVLGLRPSSITVHLFRKLRTEAEYPTAAFMTVHMNSNGKDVWNFTFEDLPRRSEDGILYDYTIVEEPVEGYVTSYLNNGRTIVNAIPEEDFPPTPTPTLPYVTPTPSPMPRVPAGVQFVDGEWVYVDEYGIPLGGIPLTGDNTNFVLWGMAIGLPLLVAALAAVEIRRRKKLLLAAEQEEEVEDFEE